MCIPTRCKVCGKATWSESGQDVQQVNRSVLVRQWCSGKHVVSEIMEAKANQKEYLRAYFGAR